MKYRKLRIAWSVAWGVLCLLLIALWVRSYWCCDYASQVSAAFNYTTLVSNRGMLGFTRDYVPVPGVQVTPWRVHSVSPASWQRVIRWQSNDQTFSACVPHAVVAVLLGIAAQLPWLPWRFTLRALLIGLTVLAVLLGLVVWAVR